MNNLNKFSISCDWLQIHTRHEDNYLAIENPFYVFKRVGQSKVFREVYEIIHTSTGQCHATYATGANECIMSKSEGILKVENRILYSNDNLKEFIQELMKKLHFKFIGFTRLDIAFDFQQFWNGRKPEDLIRDYAREKITKANNTKFAFHGEQINGKIEYQTMTLGRKSSNVYCKLYNKTREMEGNIKPWIRDLHVSTFENDKDVWRLEFSITSMNAFFKGEGRDIEFYDLNILDTHILYGIYIGLFRKYFRFRVNEPGKRLTRMKDIELWNFDLSVLELRKIMKNPLIKHSNKTVKTVIKKIDQFNNEFRLFDENLEFTAKEMVSKMVEIHGLQEWAKDQKIPVNEKLNGYANNINEYSQIIENQKKGFFKKFLNWKF